MENKGHINNTDQMLQAMDNPITSHGMPPATAPKKPKSPLMIGVVAVLFLALSGASIWGGVETMKNQELTAELAQVNNANETQLETLTLDNTIVQRLYRDFDGLKDSRFGTPRFYTDPETAKGNPDRELMKLIAISNIKQDDCRGHYPVESDPNADYSVHGCYDGERVAFKIKERFGKVVTFEDGKMIGGDTCGRWVYSAENSEFYSDSMGCDRDEVAIVEHAPYAIERKGDMLYVYEMAVISGPDGTKYDFAEMNSDGNYIGERLENLELSDDGSVDLLANRERLSNFKWTFRRTTDGNYVFAGLERL